jgi:heme/copper-type cytochrome/quinol oxidase subunit 3
MAESAVARVYSHSQKQVVEKTTGWGAMLGVIATEGALFAYLVFSYAYSAVQHVGWPPQGPLPLQLSLPNTAVLLASSLVLVLGLHYLRRGERDAGHAVTAIAIAMGAIFVGVQLLEWRSVPFTPQSGLYGSLFFTITGFHLAHVVVGLVVLVAAGAWSLFRVTTQEDSVVRLSVGALYWHFVDAVWLVIFFTLYLSPRIG